MSRGLLFLLIFTTPALAAPIPKSASPDPLGKGYIGFFPVDTNSLIIERIDPGSPASKAGLQSGDTFVQVGTCKPRYFEELKGYVSSFRPGTDVKLIVKRNGELKSFTLQLGARPNDADSRNFPLPVDP